MRGRIGVLSGFAIGNGRSSMVASFSTSGGRGRGQGGGGSVPSFVAENDDPGAGDRGRGQGVSVPNFVADNGELGGRGRGRGVSFPNFVARSGNENEIDGAGAGAGVGHGRGKPVPSNSPYPSFVAPNRHPDGDIGRGGGGFVPGNEAKTPIYLKNDEGVNDDAMGSNAFSRADFVESVPRQPIGAVHLPENILTSLTGTGMGRGKPQRKPSSQDTVKDDNRHLRPRKVAAPASTPTPASTGSKPKLSREEAIKKAVGVLSRGDERKTFQRGPGGGGGPGGRRRVGGWKDDEDDDGDGEDSEEEDRLLGVGDDADGEKLANKLGTVRMGELSQTLEEVLEETVPEPGDDEILEAYDTNLKIELEPEYLMGDFETNPDIDEKPPIPLREALEKMKPFLIAYEGIEDQEEWEQAVEAAMENVPLMKEIVYHYCGPDRVTAKQQHEELERVANTLPVSAPISVKHFTNRVVLSLQSNPGWGFHRKCQFMDKLVDEFSKCGYK